MPIYLELPEEMIFGEMIFDYATHYSLDPILVGKGIDVKEYYEFIAHRNRRKEVEAWYVNNVK